MERWIGSSAVLGECVLSIRYTLEDGKHLSNLRPETTGAFVQHIRNNRQAMRDPNIQELLRILSNHPNYSQYVSGVGGNRRRDDEE